MSESWKHTDSRGLGPAINAASSRAISGNWDSSDASKADLRALFVLCSLSAASLSDSPAPPPGSTVEIPDLDAAPYRDDERRGFAAAMLRTPIILMGPNYSALLSALSGHVGPDNLHDTSITTTDGAPARVMTGTDAEDAGGLGFGDGFLGLFFAGLLGGPLGLAAAGVDVVLGTGMQDPEQQELARLTVQCAAMLQAHDAAEKAAGRPLPLKPDERALLDKLIALQNAIAKRDGTPLPTGGIFDAVKTSIVDPIVGAYAWGIKAVALVLGLGVVGWVFFETR
jgi:hypothetical protein